MKISKEEFSRIYDEYIEPIYRFVALKVNAREIAEDLTAEVFLRFWKGRTDTPVQKVRPFLYQIARHVIADHYRKHGGKQTVSIDATEDLQSPAADELVEQASLRLDMERVQEALREISDDYQDLIIWKYIDELSTQEIAQITGKTEENVRVGLHRALQALRAKLG
ncbi:MAG: sigma-70 family RNA polymerase sigma factor [Candidatus Wildermuthbacteria bacterium]|nr:sigma-70 family RNA polymerase sigma factor [Candidatus Wildermuthbacteria bacterium]